MPRALGRNPAAAVRDPAPFLPGREGSGEGWAKILPKTQKNRLHRSVGGFWHAVGMSTSEMPSATLQKNGNTAHPGCQVKNHAAKRPVKPSRLYGPQRCDKILTPGVRRSRQSAARRAARAKKAPGREAQKGGPKGRRAPGQEPPGPKPEGAARGGPGNPRKANTAQPADARRAPKGSPKQRKGEPESRAGSERPRKRESAPSGRAPTPGGTGRGPDEARSKRKAQRRGANSPDRVRDSGGGCAAPERPSDAKSGAAGREVRISAPD